MGSQPDLFLRGFTALFSHVGLFILWSVFFGGTFLRWLANARVKSQLNFLKAFDRDVQGIKGNQGLSQAQLREKFEGFFRQYFPATGGKRFFKTLDRWMGLEVSSWQVVDRVVTISFDKRQGPSAERSRHVLSAIPSLTYFFRHFSLGALHRIGAATPALLVLAGALGTYAGFLHALPRLNPTELGDTVTLERTIQMVLARMANETGYTIIGTVLAAASVLINAMWDAERTFQSAVNRLAHTIEYLGGIEKSASLSEVPGGLGRHVKEAAAEFSPTHESSTKERPAKRANRESTLAREEHVPAPREEKQRVAYKENSETSGERHPAKELSRERSQVKQAERDWGPLPLSAVPSPKKKPIRVEAAEAPQLEELAPEEVVAAELVSETPKMESPVRLETVESKAHRAEVPVEKMAAPEPAPVPIVASQEPQQENQKATKFDFELPETALPSDWEAQINGLKNQLSAMEEKVAKPTERAELKLVPDAPAHSDSPTEAELIEMMVPKEWASQRPADAMPYAMQEEPADSSLEIAPQPAMPASVASSSAAANPLSNEEQDRLAILSLRLDKVNLYLTKAQQDLTEEIISKEMFDDECSRWHQEIESLNKEIGILTRKKAA